VFKFISMIGFLLVVTTGCQPFNKDNLNFSGTVEMTEHVLGARAAGRISQVFVEEGSVVTKGQLLATLDRYDQTKKDFERAKNLVERGGETQQALEYAQLNLNDQQVISVVDGVVLVKVHEAGEVVSAGAAVVVVGDTSSFWVRIFVPEGQINKIYTNKKVALHFDGIKQSYEGHISFIASKAEFTPRNVQTPEERVTQTFAVKVTVDQPPSFLRAGVAADVTISLEENNGK
jgi:multidrug efflux pump subunit AcrA (membrane-fusion protein)